ncbi:MAG: hypothetical protein ACHQU0_01385 [Candidatus Paceibacteria bacterium]
MTKSEVGTKKSVATEIEALRQRRIREAERAQAEKAQFMQDITAIRNLVAIGEATTGDRTVDFLLAVLGEFDDEKALAPLRALEGQMVGRKGQLFLVMQHEAERSRFGGPRDLLGASDMHLKTSFFLGVLSEEELFFDFKEGVCGLAAETYVDVSPGQSTEKTPGPFLFRNYNLYGTVRTRYYTGSKVEVIIGDAEVFEYIPSMLIINFHTWIVIRNRAARALGKEIPEAPEEVADRDARRSEFIEELKKLRQYFAQCIANPAQHKKIDESKRQKLHDSASASAKEFGLEDDPLVQLVLRDIREAV